ncbi:MAG: tryptophan synthase subunit alpha [Saprospiraceae bacterium]|nr:tryptophan synthase subunit alpha [Saprospiraceae bacterium]
MNTLEKTGGFSLMNGAFRKGQLPIMAHLVVGYPSLEESLRTAEAYIRAGVQVLELQIPFSHPTADGPIITAACREAVRQGVTVRDCVVAIAALRKRHPSQEIVAMSYLNRIYAFGCQRFMGEMEALGVQHLLVPDLPVDHIDFPGFQNLRNRRVKLVPVLAANVSDARLEKLLRMGFDFFYLMSDFKITGSAFGLHPRLREVVARIKSHPVAPCQSANPPFPRVGIGFGISTPEQARVVVEAADLAIVGSALIQAQGEGRLDAYLDALKNTFAPATECA